MQNFPSDTLQLVFTALVLAPGNEWQHIARERRRVALVCKNWKDTAYALACLWSSVAIHRFTSASHIAFCIERTKLRKLDVLIDCRSHGFMSMSQPRRGRPVTSLPMEHLLDRLLPQLEGVATRITRLTVACDGGKDWNSVAVAIDFPEAGSLVDLRVWITRGSILPPLRCTLGAAAAIAYLSLHSIQPCMAPETYRSLSTLKISGIPESAPLPWKLLHSVLDLAPLLVTLVLAQVSCTYNDASLIATLNALTTLVVVCDTHADSALLGLIKPAILSHFQLDLCGEVSIDDAMDIGAYLFEVADQVDLSAWDCGEEEIALLAAGLCNATTLDLRRTDFEDVGILVSVLQDGVRFSKLDTLMLACVACEAQAQAVLTSIRNGHCAATRLLCADAISTNVGCVEWRMDQGRAVARAGPTLHVVNNLVDP
ncbi:hypothetical protein C8R44DRAFT_866950 [Mycena epipterygia]|nr:hypothetical protein C8R44DRAFT_866950 [Mycena epipterygia]